MTVTAIEKNEVAAITPNVTFPDWAYAFSGVIVPTMSLSEQYILGSLTEEGLWVEASVAVRIREALLAQGFIVKADEFVDHYVDPQHPTRGVMETEDPEEPGTFVWALFDHG